MPVDQKKAHEVWVRYQFLRDNGHLNYITKANQCEDFFLGMQWSQSDKALLKAQRRPALTINKILATMSNVLGEQIFNRTDTAFKPRNEDATVDVASALTKVFMQISDNNQLPWVRSDVFFDGIVTGRGFFDVRLDFTDSLVGEVRVEQLNPKNVLIDADADAYDPDTWSDVIITKWLSPDQIELVYSKKDADLVRGDNSQFSPYTYDAIDRNRDRFGTPRSYAGSRPVDRPDDGAERPRYRAAVQKTRQSAPFCRRHDRRHSTSTRRVDRRTDRGLLSKKPGDYDYQEADSAHPLDGYCR